MKQFTGMNGQIVPGGDGFQVGKHLTDKKLDLAVFHGLEFAWAQARHPELRPLMVAINKHRHVRAHVVVRKEGDISTFSDLRGKDVALPKRSKDYCRLFLERSCCECGREKMKDFFGKVHTPFSVEDALDEVCQGTIQAAIVDCNALENYQELKPGCFKRLKVLKDSENFPAAVIAYRHGTLNEATLNQFRSGLLKANETPQGQQMMQLWKITAFEHVPADYAQTVADILKAYPPPAEATSTKVSTSASPN